MMTNELWPLNKFRINNKFNFINLTVNEQKAELIRAGIYIPLKIKYNTSNNDEEKIKIGHSFNLNEDSYEINPLFIESISDHIVFIVYALADAHASKLETDTQDLLKFNPDSQNVIDFLKDKKKEYINKFLNLKDIEIGFPFIESHLTTDDEPVEAVIETVTETIIEFDLVNELFDCIISEKAFEDNKFVKLWIEAATYESCIYVCNEEINELENKFKEGIKEEILDINYNTFSLPKSIAMLNEIGFFELDKIKALNETSKHKILAVILRKDPGNKNVIRDIRGNINVLKDYSLEDGTKFTSHKHINDTKIFLEKLK